DEENALRDAGLAHVLAIAGLHMALVGGGIFWLVRAALAAIPFIVLNYPIKKWAAGAALAASAFYLVISGAAQLAVIYQWLMRDAKSANRPGTRAGTRV